MTSGLNPLFALSGFAFGPTNIFTFEAKLEDSPRSWNATMFLTLSIVLFLLVTQTSVLVI